MSVPSLTPRSIPEFLKKDEIVNATALQIMKDFAMFGLSITYSGIPENAYTELLEQIVNQVSVLINSDDRRLFAVLYQVDISEKAIVKSQIDYPHYNRIEAISHQIIERELKKVLFRLYYKKQT